MSPVHLMVRDTRPLVRSWSAENSNVSMSCIRLLVGRRPSSDDKTDIPDPASQTEQIRSKRGRGALSQRIHAKRYAPPSPEYDALSAWRPTGCGGYDRRVHSNRSTLLRPGLIDETNLDRFDGTCAVWRHPHSLPSHFFSCLLELKISSRTARHATLWVESARPVRMSSTPSRHISSVNCPDTQHCWISATTSANSCPAGRCIRLRTAASSRSVPK